MSQITRREFVRTGARGLALASIPILFRFNPLAALEAPVIGPTPMTSYFEHFGVTEEMLRRVMEVALERGGDWCDLYFQHRITNNVVLEDDIVSQASTNVDYGVGIRVLRGDRTGYSFTEEITLDAMSTAARTAANIANHGKRIPPSEFDALAIPNYYKIETPWETVGIDRKIPFLKTINEKIRGADPRVVKSNVTFSDQAGHVMIVTSDGKVACDYQPLTIIRASCTAEQEGRRESHYFDQGGREGIEFYTPERIDRLARETVTRTVALFEAGKPKAGEMPVILAAGSSGILLHEAIGHPMEADFNRKDESIFADKIGKPVAEPFVSIIDDGTNANMRGSINIDDEGNQTEKTFLVENGILRSYLHDRISASHYGVQSTGSGRRQSFRHVPMPRMRNTYMLPGPHTREEIIASTKNGIIADSFTNGQVFIGAGDFTFYVKSGYLIEDGRITAPIKDINLIGNGPEVLRQIVMVGNDLAMAEGGWTCGKNGQSVPVSMGLPTVKVSSITVGGEAS